MRSPSRKVPPGRHQIQQKPAKRIIQKKEITGGSFLGGEVTISTEEIDKTGKKKGLLASAFPWEGTVENGKNLSLRRRASIGGRGMDLIRCGGEYNG